MKNSKLYKVKWQNELNTLKQQKLYRYLATSKKLDFSSNDYLSLAGKLQKNLLKELKNHIPISSGASRLLRGHHSWHEKVETKFQQFVNQEAALFFNSGYLANIGLISTLASNSNVSLFSDQLNHVSLIEGCRLSPANTYIYPHKNINKLEYLLKKSQAKYKFIITESLFSMDGDKAPLEEITKLAVQYRALCLVDEAHALGIYGKNGSGYSSLLEDSNSIIGIYPCGKALMASGAFVTGSKILKEYLINRCRSFIYTTASSPFQMSIIWHHLNFIKKYPDRANILKQKARFFRNILKDKVSTLGETDSPIVPVLVSSNTRVQALANFLQKKGYDIRPIRFPTVQKGKERIRITIHYNHTKKELQKLATCIINWHKYHAL